MNPWFEDPRTVAGEEKTLQAERAERRGNAAMAHDLYREAAEAFAAVAIGVPADHPNTRSDLAIAAVATFARAGDLGRAVDFATRILVEIDALSPYGKAELNRLRADYAALVASSVVRATPEPATRKRTLRANGRSKDGRDDVRSRFQRAGRSAE